MDESAFANLQQSIMNMKREREELMGEYLREKQDFMGLDGQVRKMQMEFDMRMGMMKDKDNKLNEYNRMIDETERTYIRIVETSNRLAASLDKESTFIREKFRKNQQY